MSIYNPYNLAFDPKKIMSYIYSSTTRSGFELLQKQMQF